jgi:hypothetical protein
MNYRTFILVATLVATGCSAHASGTDLGITIPDAGMPINDTIAMFHGAATHQDSYKRQHLCNLPQLDGSRICANVESAIREDGTGLDTFITPDGSAAPTVWCFADVKHAQVRLCMKAGTAGTTISWMEAFLPKHGEFRAIPYATGARDPDCASSQHSQFDIDGEYADCVAKKLDAQS